MAGKHSDDPKKRKYKIIIFIVLLIIIVIGGIIIEKIVKEINRPKEIVNITFTALKEANIDETKKYMDYQKLLGILDKEILNEEEIRKVGLDIELFKELNWNIEDIKVERNQAVVIVEVTNKDYKEVITQWLKKIIKEQSNGNQLTNELCLEKLKESVTDKKLSTKTIIKKVLLKRDDKAEWKVIVNDDLGSALFPGIESVNSVLSEMK